ncbi:hypothetical protein F0U60_15015 [Archangium minus]|uniref:Uncharacterized protein n=1 Tax=Archangium minus TaxID=83450 RepID=A0ABY9WNU9_9BACT|nr:hypothetical protein [Archangium violaceum]QRK06696.1 hypothetical protein JQX13_42580 [Archangium violaceum]WNG45273.1 hypothetical protein F0U60_15015 [Archangium minus]
MTSQTKTTEATETTANADQPRPRTGSVGQVGRPIHPLVKGILRVGFRAGDFLDGSSPAQHTAQTEEVNDVQD